MSLNGTLAKLKTTLADPIQYSWIWEGVEHTLNDRLGQRITLRYLERIHCCHCGRETAKSFGQGHCYPCFRRLASCDLCILKPERCHFQLGSCREPTWGEANCMRPHLLYLANTSGLKVGLTKPSQIPTRWIDQGAVQAIPFLALATRRDAGLMEDALRSWVSDKTHWRKMLSATVPDLDLAECRMALYEASRETLDRLGDHRYLSEEAAVSLNYPILAWPKQIRSLALGKMKKIEGTLLGVKGQYLILDTGVLNIRGLTGYQASLAWSF